MFLGVLNFGTCVDISSI